MIWEVARHSVLEEIVVYPLMEERLGVQGHEIAEKDPSEHQVCYDAIIVQSITNSAQEVKDNLARLESMTVGTHEYDTVLQETRDELKKHIEGEETRELPLLEGVCIA